jgi:hypothetical protein
MARTIPFLRVVSRQLRPIYSVFALRLISFIEITNSARIKTYTPIQSLVLLTKIELMVTWCFDARGKTCSKAWTSASQSTRTVIHFP